MLACVNSRLEPTVVVYVEPYSAHQIFEFSLFLLKIIIFENPKWYISFLELRSTVGQLIKILAHTHRIEGRVARWIYRAH